MTNKTLTCRNKFHMMHKQLLEHSEECKKA